jgi:hypothetical protein
MTNPTEKSNLNLTFAAVDAAFEKRHDVVPEVLSGIKHCRQTSGGRWPQAVRQEAPAEPQDGVLTTQGEREGQADHPDEQEAGCLQTLGNGF